MEDKHSKFVRLAEKRVNKAMDAIRSISKLSNRNHYEFSDQDLKKLTLALRRELDAMQATFAASLATKQKNQFKFKSLEKDT